MTFIETIEARRSVRTYSGEPLHERDRKAITDYIAGLKAPFGNKVRIELVSGGTGEAPVKLGTYGVIAGARDFLVLIYENEPMAEQDAGYLFEQVVLLCTSLGLGTCWLGGTLKKSDFAAQAGLKEHEILRIVSPVGYPAGRQRLLERVMRAGIGSANRKSFGSLFFKNDFATPLTEHDAGAYLRPLEMVRLAPSASNSQPWRVVLSDRVPHFYYVEKSGGFSPIDAGIAMCHFGETCRELGIAGKFEVLQKDTVPPGDSGRYVASWVNA